MQKTKKGGNLANELSKLSVPFGLVLAQKSLETYLDKKKIVEPKKKTSTPKKTPSKSSNINRNNSSMRKKTLIASM